MTGGNVEFQCIECPKDSPFMSRYVHRNNDNEINVDGKSLETLVEAKKNKIIGTIEICHEYLQTKWQMKDILIHELVHAYDHDKTNIKDRSDSWKLCSEIRASNLSGDCEWDKELLRGNYNPWNYYKNCIKRRSIKSMACDMREEFERTYERCITDKRPL